MLQCGCSLHFVILIALVTSASAFKKIVATGEKALHFAIEADAELLVALNETSSKADVSEASSQPARIPLGRDKNVQAAEVMGCLAGFFSCFATPATQKPPTKPEKLTDYEEAEAILGKHENLNKLFWQYYAFWQIKYMTLDATSVPAWHGLLGDEKYEPYGKSIQALGSGSYGSVTLHNVPSARKEMCNYQEKVAIKQIATKKIVARDLTVLLQEITVFEFMDNDHIINIHEVFFTPNGMFIVSEVMAGGELEDYPFNKDIFNRKDYPAFAQKVARDTGRGLKYMHQEGFIHRDLKLANVMLKAKWEEGTEFPVAKLIDFGMAEFLGDSTSTDYKGTPEFAAPEVIENKAYKISADVWSFGVLVWMLNFGRKPFTPAAGLPRNQQFGSLLKRIVQGEKNDITKFSNYGQEEARDLCINYIFVEARKRLPMSLVMHHPYFNLDYMSPNSTIEEVRKNERAKFDAALKLATVKQQISQIGNLMKKSIQKDGVKDNAKLDDLKKQKADLLAKKAELEKLSTELTQVKQQILQIMDELDRPQTAEKDKAREKALKEQKSRLIVRMTELEKQI